jgi:acetyltransferase-like isoleucine patch superfamily enzyme
MDATLIRCAEGTKLVIGNRVFAAGECEVAGGGAVEIGDDVILGTGARIEAGGGAVRIGDRVWIGDGASIRPGVSIGQGAMIAEKSVVESDVPEYAVAEGVPAKVTWRLR